MWYEPEWKLAGLIETIIQNYEDDREKYWSDDPQTGRLREFVDNVAASMVDSSDELVLKLADQLANWNWARVREVITELELSDEVRAKAEILLAWRFATTTDAMAERCIELADVVLQQHPSERILRFMRRLGRCYIAGFLPESIMVCRGVLESAVDEAVQRRQLVTDGRMRTKINGLAAAGVLSAANRDAAWTVWQRGNTAIHKDPDAVGQALETIRMVLNILTELHEAQGLSPAR